MKIMPVVMVRNEENYIAQVLRPLVTVCGRVLLGDTGSTDKTCALAGAIPGVDIIQYGAPPQTDLTNVRRDLGDRAAKLGYDWQLLCDGDELYSEAALRYVVECAFPTGMQLGFTNMVTIDLDEAGEMWELQDQFSRAALFPSICEWSGAYPFDVPRVFDKAAGFFYFPLPEGFRYHAVHLHRLARSGNDNVVAFRNLKRYQFSMQERSVPRTVKFDLEEWYAR